MTRARHDAITQVIHSKEYTTDGAWLLAHQSTPFDVCLLRRYASLDFFIVTGGVIYPISPERAKKLYGVLEHPVKECWSKLFTLRLN